MSATPIAELTPEQFNARFPVGTRVAAHSGEHETVRPANPGLVTGQLFVGTHQALYLREVHPIVTLGSLSPGDEFRWHAETPSAGVYRVKSKSERSVVVAGFTSTSDCIYEHTMLVQVVALNLAHEHPYCDRCNATGVTGPELMSCPKCGGSGESVAQDDRPEVFPGTQLREGDVVEYVVSDVASPEEVERWNRHLAPLTFRDGELYSRDGGMCGRMALTFRLVPATVPAPAPTEPCPAPEPSETEQEKPDRECARCGAPENKYRTLSLKHGLCLECSAFGDPRNNGTFLPPKPSRKLSPGVAYHLNDDCDASGIPEHH